MAIIFPDVEKLIVSYLRTALDERGMNDVRVGTIKTSPGDNQPDAEVVITGAYTGSLDYLRGDATLTVEVYAGNYQDASELALIIGALVVEVPRDQVKRCVVSLGPVRTTEQGQQERRSLSVDLIVKGQDF